jgi:hypothetical protein
MVVDGGRLPEVDPARVRAGIEPTNSGDAEDRWPRAMENGKCHELIL